MKISSDNRRVTTVRSISHIFFTLLILPCISFPIAVKAQEPIKVVASFSILADMIQRIGGEQVVLSTLVGRNGDVHVYQPTPADAKALKRADILFINGLEFEGWLERLEESAEFGGHTITATDGMKLISLDAHDDEKQGDEHGDEHKGEHEDEHHHGEYDPHGWLSLQNAISYVDNITAALASERPQDSALFHENRDVYVAEITSLDEQIKAMVASLPELSRTVVTSHDAFQYFGRDYGLTFLAAQGLSTDSEASAKQIATLIEQVREMNISAVFVENVADPRLIRQIASETGITVGGKLYPGALSEPNGPAGTYLDLVKYNAETIIAALSQADKQ